MTFFNALTHAALKLENNIPYSTQFNDIYFNPQKSIEETEYVFLKGNALIESWQSDIHKKTPWLIGETGFGTGLNFFVIANAFLKTASPHQRLHYISTELYPINPIHLQKIYLLWPQFSNFTLDLLTQYPPAIEGFYRLNFFNHRIQLTLLLGDATQQLNQLLRHPKSITEPVTMDAWVLDGFSPAKNPELWQTELCKVIARLSKTGTRFATFSAAKIVKEGLSAIGFQIQKRKGFSHKRDCLAGVFVGLDQKKNPSTFTLSDTPWFIKNSPSYPNKTAAIIGGGLAGTACAYSLAQRGWQVHLYEREADLAQLTSGNPAGVLSVNLSIHNRVHNRFYQYSYYYAVNHLQQLFAHEKLTNSFNRCGVLQFAVNEKEAAEQKSLIDQQLWPNNWLQTVSAKQASELSGIPCHVGGLLFPKSGWIQPYALCHQQCQHPNIKIHFSQSVEQLIFNENHWYLLDEKLNELNKTSVVVIANAMDALKFSQTKNLPLRPMRGQVSLLPSTQASEQLKTVLSYEGYTTPAQNSWHSVGATFSPNDVDYSIRMQDHKMNIDLLQQHFPEFHQYLFENSNTLLQGRVGMRCQTPDYLPITGPVANEDFFIENYAALRTGHAHQKLSSGHYWPGLYVSLGHGSRGLTTTNFCAEIIASELDQDFFPAETSVVSALHPARFLIRNLKRRCI